MSWEAFDKARGTRHATREYYENKIASLEGAYERGLAEGRVEMAREIREHLLGKANKAYTNREDLGPTPGEGTIIANMIGDETGKYLAWVAGIVRQYAEDHV